MKTCFPLEEVYENIYRSAFSSKHLTEEDYYLLFYLMHNYYIELIKPGIVSNNPSLTRILALTQRGAASIIAMIWSDIHQEVSKNIEQSSYRYWYYKWNGDWHGEDRFGKLSTAEEKRLEELIEMLLQNELVSSVILEVAQ